MGQALTSKWVRRSVTVHYVGVSTAKSPAAGASRTALLIALTCWIAGVGGLAVYLVATAGREQAFMLGNRVSGGMVVVPVFPSPAVRILGVVFPFAGLGVVAVAWLAAFAGYRCSRWAHMLVVGLFAVAAAGTVLWPVPRMQRWGAPSNGQQSGSLDDLFGYTTRAQQLAGLILGVAVVGAVALLVIAARRSSPVTDSNVAPPGWYEMQPGLMGYWDGSQWAQDATHSP